MRSTLPVAVVLLASLTAGRTAQAQAPGPSTLAAQWTAFRGAARDGVIREPMRLTWDGLTPRWRKPIGGGRGSFAIADGRAFTIEQRDRDEVVAAYDLNTGSELWINAWRERFNSRMMGLWGGGEGPRATPTWHEGLVYALGARGELRCLDAVTGALVWRTNILQDAGAKNLTWGMAGSPLVSGDVVIVLPGGPNGKFVAAYDRKTGTRAWTALDDKTAYASPMQVTILGVPQYLLVSASRLVGLSVADRRVLWEFPWRTDHDASATQPILVGDGRIFYSSGYGTGAVVFELTKQGDRFQTREVWRNIRMKNRQSTSVIHRGFIYGLDEGILACIDASTGDLKWKAGRYGHGQVLLVGDRLLISTEDGTLVLVQATPDTLQEVVRVPAVEGETWNVPAFADGMLLVRNTEEVVAFDLGPRRDPAERKTWAPESRPGRGVRKP